MNTEIRKFGQELRKFINSPDVFSILPEGDWGAGGCWILAESLKQFLGPPAELWAIASEYFDVEHVVVKDGDAYFDYNGASTKKELLAEFSSSLKGSFREGEELKLVRMTPHRALRAEEVGVPCEPWLVKALVTKLNARFREHDSR